MGQRRWAGGWLLGLALLLAERELAGWSWYALLGFALGAAVVVEYSNALLLPLVGLFWLWRSWPRAARRPFTTVMPALLADAAGLALVSFSSMMLTARSFAEKNGYEIDADREFSAIRDRLRSTVPSERPPESSDPRIPTPVLATYLGNRFPDAGWSRTEHYEWIAALLLELGIASLDELSQDLREVDSAAVTRAMGYQYPPGAVRRLDDDLLARHRQTYVDLPGNADRIEALRGRMARLG